MQPATGGIAPDGPGTHHCVPVLWGRREEEGGGNMRGEKREEGYKGGDGGGERIGGEGMEEREWRRGGE